MSHATWLNNPNGLIPRGTVCEHCGRFNARDITTNVVVYKNKKILLIKRASEPMREHWAIPGGYVSWDETLLQAAARELREETGLSASELYFIGTRSDNTAGDGRQNVDIYFYTPDVTGDLVIQESEVESAEWFSIDALPEPIAFNHRQLLEKFLPQIIAQPIVPIPVLL